VRRTAPIVAVISSLAMLLFQASATAGPTVLDQGFAVSLQASRDGTVNHIVVTYGQSKTDAGPEPFWGHYISDTAGIQNITNPEGFACLTEDATHDFCPDGTSAGEPGAGSDIIANLRGGDDTFTATSSIGSFEVKGGDGTDVLRGSGEPTSTRGLGSLAQAFYNGDYLYGQKGNDRLFGDLGGDFLTGGGGDDVLDGGPKPKDDDFPKDDSFEAGPGNDRVLAADDDQDNRIDCGPGKHDVAVIDRIDPKPKRCEKVRVKG
jgi:hypothetical protein